MVLQNLCLTDLKKRFDTLFLPILKQLVYYKFFLSIHFLEIKLIPK